MRRLLGAAAIAAGLFASAASAQPVGIGTSPQGTLTYALGAAFARALGESANIQARVQPSSGTGVIIPLVDSGEIDLGFVNALEITEAYRGVGSFEGRPQKNLRMLGVLFPIRVGLFVRNDSAIRTLADLRGKSVVYGYTSTPILKTVVDGMLANGGLAPGDVRPILVPSLVRGVDDFIAGRADVGFFALGQAKVAEADAAVGGIRFLPMVDEPRAVAAMQALVPGSYLAPVEPAANLPGVGQPLKIMHYDYVLFTNVRTPAARVRDFVRVLLEQKGVLAASAPSFNELRPDRIYREFPVPYHEGAEAYFRDKGVQRVKG